MDDLRAPRLRAWRHPAGPGIRRHFLVVPSVICAAQAATTIAEGAPGAVAIEHQHGCAQLGGDARLTEQVLTGLGAHPNVAGTLVVSLGCETVQGSVLHRSIVGRGQRAEFIGIQQAGGTGAAIAAGREALHRLRNAAAADSEIGLDWRGLRIGVEGSWLGLPPAQARIFRDVINRLCELEVTVVQAVPSAGEDAVAWWARHAPRVGESEAWHSDQVAYAARPSGAGFFVMGSPAARIAQKTGLAAGGAHVILSPLVAGLPTGCPVAPVVHVGIAPYARPFVGDVDVVLDEEPADGAAAAVIGAIAAACRTETVLETMGDFEMAIHRIAPTM
jgi:altronate dehydratase large subunit